MTPTQWRSWRRHVLAHSELTAAQKLVLLALETFADYPAGTNARPGVVRLAETCGLKIRVVEGTLTLARQLELIEQTARANPKRGRAACYRLISTRTDMHVETVSTRTSVQAESGFQPAQNEFQPARNSVSTRTSVQPTESEHQVISPISAGALWRARGEAVDEMIESTISVRLPGQTRARLRKNAVELLEELDDPETLAVALTRWGERSDAGPGLLPDLYADVVREFERSDPAAEVTDWVNRIALCDRCDEAGWLTGPDGTPAEPARHCEHPGVKDSA